MIKILKAEFSVGLIHRVLSSQTLKIYSTITFKKPNNKYLVKEKLKQKNNKKNKKKLIRQKKPKKRNSHFNFKE